MNQRTVWNSLASPWKTYRKRVWPETKEFMKTHSGLILDLGCGSGRNFEQVKGKTVGLDFSENMLKFAKKTVEERKLNADLVCGDLTNLSFDQEVFDACICISTLQCIEGKTNRKKALKELHRVMKKNGKLLLTCWNRDQPRFKEAFSLGKKNLGKRNSLRNSLKGEDAETLKGENRETLKGEGRGRYVVSPLKEGLIPWGFEGKKYMRYYYLFDQKELQKLLETIGFEIIEIHGSEAKAFNLFSKNIIATARKK